MSTTSPTNEVEILPEPDLRVDAQLLAVAVVPVERDGDAPVVRVVAAGELDLCTAPVLADAIRDAAARASAIEIDLAEVTFMDSQGLHLLLRSQELVGRGSARLVAASHEVTRLFTAVGMPLPN